MAVLPNDQIYFFIETYNGSVVYRTKVEDVDDDILVVATPIEQGTVVPIRPGTEVQLEYKDLKVPSEGRYRVSTVVEKRESEPIPTLTLRLLGQWERLQDRMFVRVDVFLEATFAPVVDGQVQAVRQCTIHNLSGGGLWMQAAEELPEGGLVWICLPFKKTTVQTYGEIVRVKQLEAGFGYGVAFVNIPERERKGIIQYVYQRQLELRRKGLLRSQAGGS